jgi:hypothetical protein
MTASGAIAALILAATAGVAQGHGRLTVPQARNLNDNGAVGGGPGDVHVFASNAHTQYKHGICGNPANGAQTYNAVGDVQATYTAGGVAEFKVVITAHHVGYFEFELCEDAGALSEECFTKHRLLKAGCDTDSDECRRWWKPLVEGELSQSVTAGYAGPVLEGLGNLVPYEYTMHYTIPEGVKTSNGVLRWHYMTTNSCTSKSSSPEEFWNCADIAVADGTGDVGGAVSFDNAALTSMTVENLMPAINSGALTGVYAACPENAAGELMGVGLAEEYQGLCESEDGAALGNCLDLTSSNDNPQAAVCNNVPASGIICESECGDWWYQCAHGVPMLKPVPTGTKCKENNFVVEAVCSASNPTTAAPTTPAPASTAAPTTPSTTPAPTPAPTTPSTTLATTPASTAASYHTVTEAPSSTTAAPTDAPTTPAPATAAPGLECGECTACLADNGVCYQETSTFCNLYPQYKWCGSLGRTNLRR